MNVQARIKQLCQQYGLSLSKLSKKAGLAETTVYDWFNENNRMPSIRALEDVCAVFGISLSQFFADKDMDDLTEQEIQALEYFRKIPDKKKELALSTLKAFSD